MTQYFRIDTTIVGVLPILAGEPLTRRQREKDAIRRLLTEMAPGRELAHNGDGAPALPGWNVSITHSQKLAAVAMDRHRIIGIDAEEWRKALERVKTRFLNHEELERISEPETLLRAWTVKEAVYKAAGKRLLTGPEINISPDFLTATARGRQYRLHNFSILSTQLTLAWWQHDCL